MATLPTLPEGSENFFATLPGWMQFAASAGVFIVAVAAGAYGFITKLRPGQAGVTQDAPIVIEGAGLLGGNEASNKIIIGLLKELTTIENENKILLIRIAQATETHTKIVMDEQAQEKFDKAVVEAAKEMLEARRTEQTTRRTARNKPVD